MKNTWIANIVTILGVIGMLLIAGFSLPVSLCILGVTIAGCTYLTTNENK